MGKRGQVTVFVVLGLIILILAGSFLAYRYFVINSSLESTRQELSRVPSQFQPVAAYLDECTQTVASDALTFVGSRAGYFTLPTDPLPPSSINPLQRNLEVLPNTDLKVPLWFRESSNGIQEVNVPSKADVEKNLALYVTTHFPECLDNLSSFQEEGYQIISSATQVNSKVTVTKDAVDVVVSFPMQVSFKGANFKLDGSLAHVETQFGDLYNSAVEMLTTENQGFFLENKTLDMLVAYDKEVPYSGSDLSCSETVWSKTEVIKRFKAILFENTAAIHVVGTDFSLDNEGQKYLLFDALKSKRSDVSINLRYNPSWPTLVDISPSQGDVLRSDPITKNTGGLLTTILSSYFCLNDHHFIYTIKYPVLISLTDKNGFVFQYATEVIIDRNLARENRIVPLDIPDTRSLLCENAASPLTINTYSLDQNEELVPLSGADVSFKCFPDTCPLKAVGQAANKMQVLAPPCVNGVVEVSKKNFFNGKSVVSTNTAEVQNLNIVLEPLYEKHVQVKVIDKKTGEIRDPFSSELISFSFKHQNARYNEYFTYQSEGASCELEDTCGPGLECKRGACVYPSCESKEDCSLNQECVSKKCAPINTIHLLAGDYAVESFVSRTSTWPIQTQKKTVQNCVQTTADGVLGLFFTKEKCFTTEIPSVDFKNALVGGGNFNVTFERSALASKNVLTLYVLADATPADLEGFANIQTDLSINKDNPNFRYPQL